MSGWFRKRVIWPSHRTGYPDKRPWVPHPCWDAGDPDQSGARLLLCGKPPASETPLILRRSCSLWAGQHVEANCTKGNAMWWLDFSSGFFSIWCFTKNTCPCGMFLSWLSCDSTAALGTHPHPPWSTLYSVCSEGSDVRCLEIVCSSHFSSFLCVIIGRHAVLPVVSQEACALLWKEYWGKCRMWWKLRHQTQGQESGNLNPKLLSYTELLAKQQVATLRMSCSEDGSVHF